ncbi:PAS domain S-box protein [Paenibacillus sp. M1]|uniref:histidine kinase n=1 Tax=Paenibacillus haidiansis TaxID=1574488 RepID=A0ABU7VYZ1_9BACL
MIDEGTALVVLIFIIILFAVICFFLKRLWHLRQMLKASEERGRLLENMLHNIDVGTWSYDDHLKRVVFTSRAFVSITGFLPGSFTSKMSWQNIIHPDDLNYFTKVAAGLRQGKADASDYRIIHAGGETRWVNVRIIPTMDRHGELVRLDGIVLDITEKKESEQRLQESERHFSRLIELFPTPMIVQKGGKFTYVNSAGLRLLGFDSLDEIVGQDILRILPPHEWEKAKRRIRAIPVYKYGDAIEYEVLRGDGQHVYTEVTGVYDEFTGSTVHVFYNITERKKMEIALKESMERYRRLVELSPVAIAVIQHGMVVYINPMGLKVLKASNLADIVGTTPWEWIVGKNAEWGKTVVETLNQNGSLPAEEMTLVCVDGKEIEVSVTGIYDKANSNVEVVFEDITARKQAERALMASEQLNRQLIELLPLAIFIHRDYKILYVNPAGVRMLGAKDEEEIIGLPLAHFLRPEDVEKGLEIITQVYEQPGGTQVTEYKVIDLQNRTLELEVVLTSIPYLGQGAALGLAWDITSKKRDEEERRNAEQLIRESEDRYFRLQMSLDQFSSDLFGVVKVEELNDRLVREVRQVLGSERVCLMTVCQDGGTTVMHGYRDIPRGVAESISEYGADSLPLCELVDTLDGHYVKIGDVGGDSCILCVSESSQLLMIQAHKVWLETLSRYVSVLYDNFRVIEDLRRDVDQLASGRVIPQWLLRFMFHLSENERKRLSQDLHDAALQEQIIWYRKLNQLAESVNLDPEYRRQMAEIEQGLLDVIYQIRITCNELRPPLLQEEGLERSLETLFEFTQLRTNFAIRFDYSDLGYALGDDLLIGLYRIVQELLANASKHSRASLVIIKLYSRDERVHLEYEDNGVGLDVEETTSAFQSMGIYSMRERVRSMDGSIELYSPPDSGLSVHISVPAGKEKDRTRGDKR